MGRVTGTDMAEVTLRYVEFKRDRHGVPKYWYFRHTERRWRMPGQPLSVEFMAKYHELVARAEASAAPEGTYTDQRNFMQGSFGALVRDYLDSAAFKERAEGTQEIYRRILEQLSREHGHKSLHLLKRRHVRKMRDARAETPGAANNVLRMLKIVLNFAVEENSSG